jgi:hypothetical protein
MNAMLGIGDRMLFTKLLMNDEEHRRDPASDCTSSTAGYGAIMHSRFDSHIDCS